MSLSRTGPASPVNFTPKSGEIVRLYVYYRNFDAIKVWILHLPAEMNNCIDRIVDSQVFSALIGNKSYCKIEVHDLYNPKTGITSHHELHPFASMPFGLINTSTTFQRLMKIIISFLKLGFALVYLSSIAIILQTPYQHMKHTRLIQTNWKRTLLLANLKRQLSSRGKSIKLVLCSV